MIKQLVLMAGGKGTRLGQVSKKIPKCLIKVNGIELIRHHLIFAKKNNLKRILILTGYKHEYVKKYVNKLKLNNLDIKLIKDKCLLGTGFSLIKNLKYFEETFLLVYADLYHSLNLKKFIEFHNSKNSDLTLVINKNNHPQDSNLVKISKTKKIKKFYLYPHKNLSFKKLHTNEAIFLIKKFYLLNLDFNKKSKNIDFVKDILPNNVNKINMYGYHEKGNIVDCGDLKRINYLEKLLKKN